MIHQIKKLTDLKKIKYSINGNPNYLLSFDGFTIRTQNDSMVNFGITHGMVGKDLLVSYHFTKGGKAILDYVNTKK